MTVTITEASTQLAQLLEKAASGEEIYISREGASTIRLTPVATPEAERPENFLPPRIPGLGKGQVWIAPDFDAPMPDDWLNEFYSGEITPCEP